MFNESNPADNAGVAIKLKKDIHVSHHLLNWIQLPFLTLLKRLSWPVWRHQMRALHICRQERPSKDFLQKAKQFVESLTSLQIWAIQTLQLLLTAEFLNDSSKLATKTISQETLQQHFQKNHIKCDKQENWVLRASLALFYFAIFKVIVIWNCYKN